MSEQATVRQQGQKDQALSEAEGSSPDEDTDDEDFFEDIGIVPVTRAPAIELINPLSASFNPSIALSGSIEFTLAKDVRVMSSLDEFEQNLVTNERETLDEVMKYDESEGSDSDSMSNVDPRSLPFGSGDAEGDSASGASLRRPAYDIPLVPTRGGRHGSVLYQMAQGTYSGPLWKLCEWARKECRVYVWIRRKSGIRCRLIATLVAMDCMWNLALRDVDERYYPDDDDYVFRKSKDGSLSKGRRGRVDASAEIPPFMYYEQIMTDTGVEITSRHVNQLFVRGDNVIFIANINKSNTAE